MKEKFTTDRIKGLEFQIELLKKRISYLENMLREYLPLSINKLLKMRGFNIIRKRDNLALVKEENQKFFYSFLKSYYFRRVLRDVLFIGKIGKKEKELIKEKWGKVTDDYITEIEKLGILKRENNLLVAELSLGYMGTILEWFMGKYLKEELGLETATDVKLKNLESGGDIDVLTRIGAKLIMIECKESPPNNISVTELESIFNRIEHFRPDSFILLIDTTLSVKRNIIDNARWILHTEPRQIKEGVYLIKNNYYVITAKRDLLQNIATAIKLIP